MLIQGLIVDKTSNTGIPGASIVIQNEAFQNTGQGTAANSAGYFSFNANVVEGDYVVMSSVGYKAIAIPIETYNGATVSYGLERNAVTLPPVVVTSKPKMNLSYLLLALVVVGIAYNESGK